MQKVQRQQVLKRLRNAQEIQRRLEELEIQQKELEQQGVEVEKMLRGEQHGMCSNLIYKILKIATFWFKGPDMENTL